MFDPIGMGTGGGVLLVEGNAYGKERKDLCVNGCSLRGGACWWLIATKVYYHT